MNYGSNQWLIVSFSPGSGGKFLSNCLMQYDKIAHWHGIMPKMDRVNYFLNSLPDNNNDSWIKKEMTPSWGLNFFSRLYPRNNNMQPPEFNQNVAKHATDYFHECWNNNDIILDYWHKSALPDFWKEATEASIIIDDFDLYKKLLFSKPYTFKDNIVKSLCDNPDAHSTSSTGNENAKLFNNKWIFNDIDNIDTFFNEEIEDKCWFDKRMQLTPNDYSINLTDLFDYDLLCAYLERFEDLVGEKLPRENIKQMHTAWLSKTNKFLSNL
jgi:hypothetical protein